MTQSLFVTISPTAPGGNSRSSSSTTLTSTPVRATPQEPSRSRQRGCALSACRRWLRPVIVIGDSPLAEQLIEPRPEQTESLFEIGDIHRAAAVIDRLQVP